MKSVQVQQYDSFTKTPFAGNPAGVVLDANGLSDREMQYIAREMNCSETVFVLPAGNHDADFRMRYFTPAVEVDLCGHATIAGLTALGEAGRLQGAAAAQTNAGVLEMEVRSDASAWMRQARPQFRPLADGDRAVIARLLGIPQAHLVPDIQIGLAYTGLWDLMVPVDSMDTLQSLVPAMVELAAYNRHLGVASTHVFCMETMTGEAVLHARDFSPTVGIPEDPHTGTASGALGAWLVHQGVLAHGEYTFEQGWSVERPGVIQVRVPEDGEVWVGGHAVEVIAGAMRLE